MSNLYYPQLATGAIAQYPSRKMMQRRTIVNRSQGDRAVKMADPEGSGMRWELGYSGLTDAEIAGLEDLFKAAEGRLRSFVFLDPSGNLLRWTEDLSKSVWQGSTQVMGDIEDPEGGNAASRITNAAQAAQRLSQTIDAPGWYWYSFSLWVRSSSTNHVILGIETADGEIAVSRPVSPEWEAVHVSGAIAGEAETLRCFVELPAASALDVYGLQLDAQRDSSGYRKTTDTSGVYLARFDQDEFECVSYGPDNHSISLQIVTVRKATT